MKKDNETIDNLFPVKSETVLCVKHHLKRVTAVLMSLLVASSVMSAGITSAFAEGEETQQPVKTQQQEQPESGEINVTQFGGADCVDDQIIVKFKETVSEERVANTLDSVESGALQQLPSENLVVSEVPEGETVESFIETMEAMPEVEYAQPNYIYTLSEPGHISGPAASRPAAAVNDPYAGHQWYLNKIRAYDAWNITMGSPGVRVAVLDTGVDIDHPDLAGQIAAQADVVDNDTSADDDYGHGTHVAGIIGAIANNGIGVAGVAPGAKLIAVDVFMTYMDNGVQRWGALTLDVIEGINFALSNGADVINLSLGSYDDDYAFESAINNAVASGVPVICSAGNDNVSYPHYPSDYEAAVSVIATGWDDTRASYSNYGAEKDISAPGGDTQSSPDSYILSTYPGQYAWMCGTSMATPVVSGVAALMLSVNPSLSPAQLKSILYATAVELGAPGKDIQFGEGRVDAYYAVAAAAAPVHVTGIELSSRSETLSPGGSLTLGATLHPGNTTFPKIIWSSSNSGVAAVDSTGKVMAMGEGSAIITAAADGVSESCSITVAKPQYTVTFNSMGGTPVPSVSLRGGESIPSPPLTFMEGGFFAGWYTTPQYNTAPVSFPYVVTGNVTLYARWTTDSFIVVFDSQGGSAVPAQSVAFNCGVYQPAAPYRPGYAFAGWYRELYCATAWRFGYDMVQYDTTLYAKWQKMGPDLANISLSAGSLSRAFSGTVYSYKVYLGENEPGVMITPEREYSGASMTINGRAVESTYVSLANGKSAKITIKTKYGKTAQTYKLTVTRAKSANSNLASLTATAGALDKPFDPNVISYTLVLDENTSSTVIKAVAAAGKAAKVSPGSKRISLKNGQSKAVKITVRAQSGARKTYVVNVVRAPSSNANLKSLRAPYMSPSYSPNTTDYFVTLPANKGSISISAKPAGNKAAVYIDGAKKSSKKITLANGQSVVVHIAVTAQSSNTRDYSITVYRP
jgi:uncharacterized repeat protein (TIGR02543 family)